ncbi:hypothetical protein FGIG_07299 [Fasciola gigantica]|uniref:G-protein coupled receptors family 1 profile domain-containing protein n=1 Tax=Fasciola gigantica TaxID=46835 RepID=A0A504YW73_FASGI|nr:hypothetical protein FGIG_07299 [Fasciola gigantica]
MADNQVNGDNKDITILKNVAMSSIIVFGLIGNALGFVLTYYVKVRFPATRLLLRLQYIIDAFGCFVVTAYWVTYNIKIPPELLDGSAFSYIWSNYYVAGISSTFSSTNMMLLSLDRYWAVVWFTTYRRDSKYYRFTLMVVLLVWVILITTPTAILGYYGSHIHLIGSKLFIICLRTHAILVFLLVFLGPGILILASQVKIIILLRRLESGSATSSLSVDRTEQSNTSTIDPDMKSYPFFEYLLSTFRFQHANVVDGWKNNAIFPFSCTFSLNPLSLIFISPVARKWILSRMSVCRRTLLMRTF